MESRRRDVLALCYHGIHPDALHGEVTPDAFRAQLAYVASRGYGWATFTEAVLGEEPGRVAAITFDDGIASAIEHGLPLLDEVGAPATMFPRLDMLGASGSLTEADVGALAEHGWEIGSHTVTHPVLTGCEDVEVRRELAESRMAIERLSGRACLAIAYPTGRVDGRVASAAKAAGYLAGAALEGAIEGPPGPLAWPRVGVRGDDSPRVFRIKCSGPVRRVRSSWLRGPAGRLASGAGRARRRLS